MTRILDQLIGDGLASRSVEARDGRRHSIRITAAGRRACSEAVPRMIEPLKRAFSGLEDSELATLNALLRKAITSFDKGAQALRSAA